MPAQPRLDVFIDANNFAIACRDFMGDYVDVKALAKRLAKISKHELGAVFYYDSPSPTPRIQTGKARHWEALQAARVTVKKGRLESNYDGTHREKECDVMIAVDMVVRAHQGKYNRAMLVSADTDLAYAIESVHEMGKEVGWAFLPIQRHVDRLRQVVPKDHQIALERKLLKPIFRSRFRSR